MESFLKTNLMTLSSSAYKNIESLSINIVSTGSTKSLSVTVPLTTGRPNAGERWTLLENISMS